MKKVFLILVTFLVISAQENPDRFGLHITPFMSYGKIAGFNADSKISINLELSLPLHNKFTVTPFYETAEYIPMIEVKQGNKIELKESIYRLNKFGAKFSFYF